MININQGDVQDNHIVEQTNNIINVDRDFGGDLESAIAAADDGDVVKLGNNVYFTDGITINKDITIDGLSGQSIINGNGTDQPILNVIGDASGSTIRDLEITNGNIGVMVDRATDVSLSELTIHDIGINETIREGQNNIGVSLYAADGFELSNSEIFNVGRKGVGINDTDGGIVTGVFLEDINLDAQHAQSYDAAGIKLFNTNDVVIADNELLGINAFHIWNDITSGTSIESNTITGVGEDFLQPEFNPFVDVGGIYNEKSYNSVVRDNNIVALDNFTAFRATEFTTETMVLQGNDFSSSELNTEDFWANEAAERLIAITEDPEEANFDLYAEDFFAEAIISD